MTAETDRATAVDDGEQATPLRSGLARYVALRLATAAAVLATVSVVVFLFVHAAPGGPEYAIAGSMATPDQLANIRELHGLDRPLVLQYLQYLGSLAQLDLGTSFSTRIPVTESLAIAVLITVPLALMTWVFAMTAGIVMGIVTASRPGGPLDRVVLGATTVGASAPAFAVGTLLAYVFGIRLGWFPVLGAGDAGWDRLRHLVLPAATAGVVLLATCTRFTRVRIGQIMAEDQTTFARARGLDRAWVLRNVLLRNGGVQLVTLSGTLLIGLVANLVVVEQVFNLPGLGSLMLGAIRERDIALLQGVTLVVCLFVVVVNLVADLVCMAVDPRLRIALGGPR